MIIDSCTNKRISCKGNAAGTWKTVEASWALESIAATLATSWGAPAAPWSLNAASSSHLDDNMNEVRGQAASRQRGPRRSCGALGMRKGAGRGNRNRGA